MTSTDRPTAVRVDHRDRMLVSQLIHGDGEALLTVTDLFGRHVYGRALQILSEPKLAEKVAQDTLLVLWWQPTRFDPSRGSILSFLMGEARSRAIDALPNQQGTRRTEALLSECRSFLESPSVADETEGSVRVREAISSLPSAKREVIFLAFYKGLTYSHVAKVLTLPEGAVKSRIRESLAQLRGAFDPARRHPA